MDQLQDDKVPEDNNINIVTVEDNTNDEKTQCIENNQNIISNSEISGFEINNPDQKDVKNISITIIGEDGNPVSEENSENNNIMEVESGKGRDENKLPGEVLMETEEKKLEEKIIEYPATITDDDNPPKSEDNLDNNNLLTVVSESEKGRDENKILGEVLMMETGEEKKQKEDKIKSSSIETNKERPKAPINSSLANIQTYIISDDDSVDSSSDSSSSSSSSSDDESSSSDDDDMNEKKDDNDQVGLPKKIVASPVAPTTPEEVKKKGPLPLGSHENGDQHQKVLLSFPASYRENDDDSSTDSSSDSSTSSSTESEDTEETDHTLKPTNQPKPPKEKDSDGEEKTTRPRAKGEIFPEELPALENLNINIDDNVDLKLLGKITSVIKNIAVAHAEFESPIDQDSMIFLNDRTCIGKVHDIMGPVREPFYMIILEKNYTTIPLDTEIYCAPEEKEYTKYVFVNDLKKLKGSDASWEHDIEPPLRYVDYSDDEQERTVKKQRNKSKNSANGETNDDPNTNDTNGKSRHRNRHGPSSTGNTNPRNWRKRGGDQNQNQGSLNSSDAAQRSMFACSTQWPLNNVPGRFTRPPPSNNRQGNITSWPPSNNGQGGNYTSWTPPKPPQFQPPNIPTYQEEYNRLNQMIWPPNNQQQQPNPQADTWHQNNQQPNTRGTWPQNNPQGNAWPSNNQQPNPQGNAWPPNNPQGNAWPPNNQQPNLQGNAWPPNNPQGNAWPPNNQQPTPQGNLWPQNNTQGNAWPPNNQQPNPQADTWPQNNPQQPNNSEGNTWPQNNHSQNQQPDLQGDMRAPPPPSWNFPQGPPNAAPYPGEFNHPQGGNSFGQPPPNRPWYQGPQRPPLRAQGPPPPPKFSQPPQFPGAFR